MTETAENGKKETRLVARSVLRGLIVIAVLVGVGLLLRAAGIDQESGARFIDTWVRGRGLTGEMLFVILAAVATAVGLPRQLAAFLGGYAFGLIEGTGLSLLGAVFGCIISFGVARWLAHDFVVRHLPRRLRRADTFLADNTFSMALLIRLLPAGSNILTNLAAGVSSAGAVGFFFGSALGYIPQMVIFALLGSGINLDPGVRITASVALFLASAGLGFYLYRRYRAARALATEISGEEPL